MKIIENASGYNEALEAPLSALYYFTDNCGICQVLKPKVSELFESLSIPLHGVNLMEHAALAAQQLILGVPTLIVYQNGKEVLREGAYLQIPDLRNKLEALLKEQQ